MNISAQQDSILRHARRPRAVVAALLFTASAAAAAADATESAGNRDFRLAGGAPTAPHWSLEIKSGRFEPELEEWATFYGDEDTSQFGFALAYKVLRWAETGIAIDRVHDEGVGTLPLNNMLGGEVDFQMYPVHLYVLLRGVFFENQWVVPYVGGGGTRVYYRQEIDNQSSVRGKVDGTHVRFGLQILLDVLDEGNAAGFVD
jgi:hypothetical protein